MTTEHPGGAGDAGAQPSRPGPERTCVGCRTRRPQRELVRLVARDGRLAVGAGEPGRGAWLCRADALGCFDAAVKARRWGRAFRREVSPGSLPDVRQMLVEVR